MSDDDALASSPFENPGGYSQGKTRNLLIFLTLSLITVTQAFESTSLCVTLPVNLSWHILLPTGGFPWLMQTAVLTHRRQ